MCFAWIIRIVRIWKKEKFIRFFLMMSSHPSVELEVNLVRELPNIKGSPIHTHKNHHEPALEAMRWGGNLIIAVETKN